jgi:ankyrin repeat protein
MLHARTVAALLVLLMIFMGCNANRQVARNPDTEALFSAAREGHADTVKALLTSGKPEVNGRDEGGNTPLIEAARNGHDGVVQALLIAKADVRAKNNGGQTALMLAVQGGHDEVVRLLKQAGAPE